MCGAPLGAGMAASPAPGDPLEGNQRYVKIQDLARGAFGFVALALDRTTGEQVALKFIERGPGHITKYVEREITNHMRLRHPHIVSLREVFLTKSHLVLAMEYAPGGDLFRHAAAQRGLPEDEARWFFQQVIIAVDYCHRMGVSSRDIKLENTLLDGSPRSLIKLADFGFSKDVNAHSAPTSRVGTPAYLAPEVITNQPGQTYDGKKADIWSCGVLLYVMCTDSFPFRRPGDENLKPNEKLNSMLQRILQAEYSFPPSKPLSPEAQDLITRILVPQPDQRPTLQEIQGHPWYLTDLNAAALCFNDDIVKESLATGPSEQLLAEVGAIVSAARQTEAMQRQHEEHDDVLGPQQAQQADGSRQGGDCADDFLCSGEVDDAFDLL